MREVTLEPRAFDRFDETGPTVLVADCRACGERHYPARTLEYLTRRGA